VNQVRNRQRWWRRRHRGDQVSLDEHLQRHGDVPVRSNIMAPDRMFANHELAERLQAALERLPFEQRTAIVLREIEGLSYDEIAFTLQLAVGTVKSRLTRARQALRAELRAVR
jgi:RNA polymerase sigma-70 factor (ECF subfamily)